MRVLRRPRGFGVRGVCWGPLPLGVSPLTAFGAASFGAVSFGAFVAAFLAGAFVAAAFVARGAAFAPSLASAITTPHQRARMPDPVLVRATRCRRVRFPDAPCGAGGCC